MEHGPESQPEGYMVAVDVRSGKPEVVKLVIHGTPTSNWSFHPHGIFFSSRSQRLYTVNHSGESRVGTRVEVFSVKENAKGLPEVSADRTCYGLALPLRTGVPRHRAARTADR
jgi:hypothetical protein